MFPVCPKGTWEGNPQLFQALRVTEWLYEAKSIVRLPVAYFVQEMCPTDVKLLLANCCQLQLFAKE